MTISDLHASPDGAVAAHAVALGPLERAGCPLVAEGQDALLARLAP